MRIYKNVNDLPSGHASDKVAPGCTVLEGGAFRGVYTSGVLDRLMQADINMECTIGVSAGAMNGFNYVSGQIGRSGRINLTYRHDSRYIGYRALRRNHGITGFDFLFNEVPNILPFDETSFNSLRRRFVVVATNCVTGEPVYFEKGQCGDIFKAAQASASVPVASKMVYIDGSPYLDGGCSIKIPVDWAIAEGYEKIIVVRTRDRAYRKPEQRLDQLYKRLYDTYPLLLQELKEETERYNTLCDHIDKLEKQGRIFVIAPTRPVRILRFEGDMEKLGLLYQRGYFDAGGRMHALEQYLK